MRGAGSHKSGQACVGAPQNALRDAGSHRGRQACVGAFTLIPRCSPPGFEAPLDWMPACRKLRVHHSVSLSKCRVGVQCHILSFHLISFLPSGAPQGGGGAGSGCSHHSRHARRQLPHRVGTCQELSPREDLCARSRRGPRHHPREGRSHGGELKRYFKAPSNVFKAP